MGFCFRRPFHGLNAAIAAAFILICANAASATTTTTTTTTTTLPIPTADCTIDMQGADDEPGHDGFRKVGTCQRFASHGLLPPNFLIVPPMLLAAEVMVNQALASTA